MTIDSNRLLLELEKLRKKTTATLSTRPFPRSVSTHSSPCSA